MVANRIKSSIGGDLIGKSKKRGRASDFITDLHALAKPYGYKDLEEELIRDRILAGMSNQALSEALQMDPKVTLGQVVQKASMSEEVK